tara:strand:+ start:2558 stop:2809 length:252 start_codon:yes stop_codon:yes gene_type:complete
MPYKTTKVKGGYRVKNRSSGRVVAKKTTKTKAKKQISLLNSIDRLKKHAKKHTKKHMASMKRDMKKGISFTKAHKNAIKKKLL